MILSDGTLRDLLSQGWLIENFEDQQLINPASIDIRIGRNAIKAGVEIDLKYQPLIMAPLAFALVETYEVLRVPVDMAVELRLKSSMARMGWNHSLAFWFDPGWYGIGTMEVFNQSSNTLELFYSQRFAQIIVHKLDAPAQAPYRGRYQNAFRVEGPKT